MKGTTKFEQEALYKTPAEIKAAIDPMEKQLPQVRHGCAKLLLLPNASAGTAGFRNAETSLR